MYNFILFLATMYLFIPSTLAISATSGIPFVSAVIKISVSFGILFASSLADFSTISVSPNIINPAMAVSSDIGIIGNFLLQPATLSS